MDKDRSRPIVALWMYRNDGGDVIQEKLVHKLESAGCAVVNDFDMRRCEIKNGMVFTEHGFDLRHAQVLYHMNADEQSPYQHEVLRTIALSGVEVINSWNAFSLSRDKFVANTMMARAGIDVAESRLIARDTSLVELGRIFDELGTLVVKPRGNHGGRGIVKIDNPELFRDFVQASEHAYDSFYLERFIPFGDRDYRIEVFDGAVIGGYSRKLGRSQFKTNVAAGGSMVDAMPSDEFAAIALRAASLFGLTTTIVDMVRSTEDNKIYVLEVNPIMGIFVQQACTANNRPFYSPTASYCNDELKLALIADLLIRKAFNYFTPSAGPVMNTQQVSP